MQDGLLDTFFNLDIFGQVLPLMLKGLWMTFQLSVFTIVLGLSVGLLIALGVTQRKSRALRIALTIYIDLFRALPPLVLLIFISFLIHFWGMDWSNWGIIALSFTLSTACYYGEILRAGIEAVPGGQVEASRSTGMSATQTLRCIVLPQAFRSTNPELCSNSLLVIKMTAIASVVGLQDLLGMARNAQSLLYSPAPLILCALIYLVLLWPAVRWVSSMSEREVR
ncbi:MULTISPECIES: amino acid ABC transporter permease [unclassified Achromobacter]|uniref:amino acid ABC transporter permease n=1 Tax=unclassified Achromobacter TaxID=2626865 RepID=UPI000B516037|nr:MULTISPECIES: amino acid ABC transporter permease [unclassified Achromobacter]OWT71526.1 polar amino acid ABC transporter permease [Achromobacter sp. HZ34]OWT73183.1 polar amino acid ABC transporter permease [Achromobacter sp. HZ28]